jgi:hypothetical protein
MGGGETRGRWPLPSKYLQVISKSSCMRRSRYEDDVHIIRRLRAYASMAPASSAGWHAIPTWSTGEVGCDEARPGCWSAHDALFSTFNHRWTGDWRAARWDGEYPGCRQARHVTIGDPARSANADRRCLCPPPPPRRRRPRWTLGPPRAGIYRFCPHRPARFVRTRSCSTCIAVRPVFCAFGFERSVGCPPTQRHLRSASIPGFVRVHQPHELTCARRPRCTSPVARTTRLEGRMPRRARAARARAAAFSFTNYSLSLDLADDAKPTLGRPCSR